MMRGRSGVCSLAVVLLVGTSAGQLASADAAETTRDWDPLYVETTASLLSTSLEEMSAATVDVTPEDARSADVARNELAAAALEMQELVRRVADGENAADTSSLFRKLQARRQAFIAAGMAAKSGGPPKEQIEAAAALWEEIAAYYRGPETPR